MLQLRKLHIEELPLKDIATMTETELESWCEKNAVNRMGSWLLPQLVAAFGSWSLARDSSGLIDVKQTLKLNCEHNPVNQAMWRLSRIARTCLLTKQVALPEYAVLTPLILAGFKRMQGVQYEQWRGLDNLEYIVEPRLLEAVTQVCPDLGSERLLEIRQQGLTTRSGKTAGQLKSAESTWSLTGIQDTELGHLPKLTVSIITQIWLAHPQHRHSLMILDPQNWDRMPEPLIAPTIFATNSALEQNHKEPKESTKTLLPWM